MRDPGSIQRLERIYNLLTRSFLRYVSDLAGTRALDGWDRRALEVWRTWRAAERNSLARIEGLLVEERIHPQPGSWPVEFSQYHYLRASLLLRAVARKMEIQIALIEKEAEGLTVWPGAAQAVKIYIDGAQSHLKAVQDLEEERPKEPPPPGAKKGVSASRW